MGNARRHLERSLIAGLTCVEASKTSSSSNIDMLEVDIVIRYGS